MPATPQSLDMNIAPEYYYLLTGLPRVKRAAYHEKTPEQMNARERKQMRARMRKKREEEFHANLRKPGMAENPEILENWYDKPINQWDIQELARGRPRNASGNFRGTQPSWINQAVHEDILRQFQKLVKGEMNKNTVLALETIKRVMKDDGVDHKGKPRVGANTKLDAAKFLIEHLLGKPKQRVETDISIRLQALLGTSMVNPIPGVTNPHNNAYALTQGYVDADAWEEDDDLDSRSGD